MTFTPQFSGKFVDLVKAVTQAPTDYEAKKQTLGLLRPMKALAASGDPVAQYRLAQVYPKNSELYTALLQAAAEQNFTNAMLDLSIKLVENNAIASLRQAAGYLVKILASDDSYIKTEAMALINRNPELNAEVIQQMNISKPEVNTISFIVSKRYC